MSEIRVNKLINEAGTGSVELTQGATLPSGKTLSGAGQLNITGIATFGGNVTIGGTLTYEDVQNVDSVGLITARSGIEVVGFVTAQSGSAVTFSGGANITNAVETVNTGSYATGADPVSGITTESPAPTLLSVLKPDTFSGVNVTLVPIPFAVVVLP